MKLRALRLHGFKSFADRTDVVFHEGLTAIVGPNGCGKSNISDAIRWVLGEQRPTAIRGARMEEAIFQGTVHRRPVNRASVSMEVSNEDGALPVPFGEVEISRTVYRDGGSEYALNRASCRLRDIQDLCRDTGLGSNAYSIIENRMIDAILSDRAEERRSLFEEAAGIGKYKDRRRSALRRLERAELDLQRLDDLVGEVESKVRSLARQKGRAQRYREMRSRRLDLEVTLARRQLRELDLRTRSLREELSGGREAAETLRAGIQTAETRLESLRARRLEAERARAGSAAELEAVRGELVRWEREVAVASERALHAERRLEQIGVEREALELRRIAAREEMEALVGREAELVAALDALVTGAEKARAKSAAVREQLSSARQAQDDLERREREVARRIAQLQGDAEAAESQGEELSRRAALLGRELDEADRALQEVLSQGDLFQDRVAELGRARAEAEEALEKARGRMETLSAAADQVRREELEAAGAASALEARLAELERMERDGEGSDPVVRALVNAGLEGVLGVLADAIVPEPVAAKAVEAYLGPALQGVVVADTGAAERAARWFREEWKGGGGLVLLPLDRVPRAGKPGSLLARVEVSGQGAPWARVLLAGADLRVDEDLFAGTGDRVGADGSVVDRLGVLRLGRPVGTAGLLERRERLEGLRTDAVAARAEAERVRSRRERAQEDLRRAEAEAEEARRALERIADAHREARADAEADDIRRKRLADARADLERQRDLARAGAARASERARESRAEREALREEEDALREARTEARRALGGVEEAWEAARSEEAAVSVEEARARADAERARERVEDLGRSIGEAEARAGALDAEAEGLRREVEASARLRAEGESATTELFRARDAAEQALRERDEVWEELEEEVTAAERRVRQTRDEERDASERRHGLELELQDLQGRVGRVEERLEGEWGRPLRELFEQAGEVEGDPEVLQEEVRELARALERLGPVNMLAVEEHEEESARLAFLTEQRADLVEARDDLRQAIREINRTAVRLFEEAFEEIRSHFRDTFVRLFEGGECDLWLSDPDDPLESPVEIHASPRGKRTQRIDLLSGGERALTALSLLFGIYLVKPSPFCVLDEVDAPLDESNIGRFVHLLQELKAQTQFVVITHNPRTIEAADWIYGVTMEEPGVSSIVGVQLEEALEAAAAVG